MKPCSGSSDSVHGAWAAPAAEEEDRGGLETSLRRDLLGPETAECVLRNQSNAPAQWPLPAAQSHQGGELCGCECVCMWGRLRDGRVSRPQLHDTNRVGKHLLPRIRASCPPPPSSRLHLCPYFLQRVSGPGQGFAHLKVEGPPGPHPSLASGRGAKSSTDRPRQIPRRLKRWV